MRLSNLESTLYLSATLVFAVPGFCQAALVSGSIWQNQPVGASNATLANVPTTAPDVTFTTSQVKFSSFEGSGNGTIGGFLNAFNPANIITGASKVGDSIQDTIWNFKGTVDVKSGTTFNVAHDDGVTLIIGGKTVIDAAGPTSPDVTSVTYTGASGNLPFELVYGECCSLPAKLDLSSLPLSGAPVPLPAALPFLASGLATLGFFRRKRPA